MYGNMFSSSILAAKLMISISVITIVILDNIYFSILSAIKSLCWE